MDKKTEIITLNGESNSRVLWEILLKKYRADYDLLRPISDNREHTVVGGVIKVFNQQKDELATMQAALEAQSKEIANMRRALEKIIERLPLYMPVGLVPDGIARNLGEILEIAVKALPAQEKSEDKSFESRDDAVSNGCVMCGNEWKSLNSEGYCSSCWQVYNS